MVTNALPGAKAGGRKAGGQAANSGRTSTAVGKDCNSFVPDARVLMADGTSKPIEDVEVGDLVAATDPIAGGRESRPVEALITGEGDKTLITITTDLDGDPATTYDRSTVTATDKHEFWVDDQGQWINAEDLHPGDLLRQPDGSQVLIVDLDRRTVHQQRVHNLTIHGIHTYYVAAGRAAVLVHNCVSGSKAGQDLADQIRSESKTAESASRAFTGDGKLAQVTLNNSKEIIPGSKIGNPELRAMFAQKGGIAQWGKYTTESYGSPSGNFQVHFYRNSKTGEVLYGNDYKVVFNARGSSK